MSKEIEVSKARLAELYATMPVKDVCRELSGMSKVTLYKLLDRAGIPIKRPHKEYVRPRLVD